MKQHIYKIISYFMVAVLVVLSVLAGLEYSPHLTANAALSESARNLWGAYKSYYDVSLSGAFDALTDYVNYGTNVNRRIWGNINGNNGGHGGGGHERMGAITTFVDAPSAVFNEDGFADAAAALLVPYAKAATGKDGVTNVIEEITVPEQYDFTGMIAFHNESGTYNELFQIHIKYNGYRYRQDFYPDCACYFSRIDDSGVTQTQVIYMDPTIAPTFNTDYVDDTGVNGLRFYARFYINGNWEIRGIQFRTNSVNSIDHLHERWSASDWWQWWTANSIGNPFGYPWYITDALTNDSAVYNLIRQQEEKQGNGFKIPIGVGGAAAGAIVNIGSLLGGFSFDSVLGGLSLNFEDLLGEFTANLGDSIQGQYDDLYSNIANYNELWLSDQRQNLYELYNYLEPLPPSTGGGLPDSWLDSYPAITTAFYIEPYPATLPPSSLPSPAEPLTDITQTIFDSSGLAPVAVALGLLGVIAVLI